jgi:hypothetical protein
LKLQRMDLFVTIVGNPLEPCWMTYTSYGTVNKCKNRSERSTMIVNSFSIIWESWGMEKVFTVAFEKVLPAFIKKLNKFIYALWNGWLWVIIKHSQGVHITCWAEASTQQAECFNACEPVTPFGTKGFRYL